MERKSSATYDALHRLYNTEGFAGFFDWASEFKNDVSQTTVSRIQTQIESGSGERPKAALEFCRMLEEAGCGRLVLGRHGKKSRMEWAYTLRSIGDVARRRTNDLEPRDEDLDDEDHDQPAMIRFEIPLRSNLPKASVELPEGYSESDLKKLILFIQRLL